MFPSELPAPSCACLLAARRRSTPLAVPLDSLAPGLPSAGSHNNLWSNIDVGAGRRTFASSGAGIRGAHAASNNTWWNIYASGKPGARLALPSCDFGPQLNFIGSSFGPPAKGDAGVVGRGSPAGAPTRLFPAYCARRVRWWVEVAREGATVRPKDLLAAMRSTQRARLGGRSSLPGG
jgi:hypothetical protein